MGTNKSYISESSCRIKKLLDIFSKPGAGTGLASVEDFEVIFLFLPP